MVDDKVYWENFYAQAKMPFKPSLFSRFVRDNYLRRNDLLIELGCGNGRDAFYFAQNGINTTAVDQCEKEIRHLNEIKQQDNLKFECRDFTNLSDDRMFNAVYSRFTLHSIAEEQEDKVFKWASNVLSKSGYMCIEVRGMQNELYMKGKPVEGQENAFIYENHYRRFLDMVKTCKKLERNDLKVKLCVEKKGFSPFNGKDETFMRIIAQKEKNRFY